MQSMPKSIIYQAHKEPAVLPELAPKTQKTADFSTVS
jgi:hypothetical protein